MIDRKNFGVCKKCGETKQFPNLGDIDISNRHDWGYGQISTEEGANRPKKHSPLLTEEVDRILAYIKEHPQESMASVGHKFDRSTGAIQGICKAHDIPRHHGGRRKKETREAATPVARGSAFQELKAKRAEVCKIGVDAYCEKHGISRRWRHHVQRMYDAEIRRRAVSKKPDQKVESGPIADKNTALLAIAQHIGSLIDELDRQKMKLIDLLTLTMQGVSLDKE